MRGKVLENTRSKEELLKNLLRHSGAKKKKKSGMYTCFSCTSTAEAFIYLTRLLPW